MLPWLKCLWLGHMWKYRKKDWTGAWEIEECERCHKTREV